MFQVFDKLSCGVKLWPLALLTAIAACTPAPPAPEAIAPSPSADAPAAAPANPSPAAPTGSTALDITLIPGERVGPVTATTSHADLVNEFGSAALEDGPVAMGEGFTQPGTRVTPTPGGEDGFTVVWLDDSRTRVDQVREFGPAWQLRGGIGVGTEFATLQEVLGPFQLYGFAWDYGGTLELVGTSLDADSWAIVLRVGPRDLSTPLPETLLGDSLFPSDHPDLPGMDLVVREMIIFLGSE